ncbi:MAG: hypothetical protein ACYSUS_09665 [Planctomycetota bacterium]
MQTMYKIVNAKSFIKAKPNGITDLEQSKQSLLELAMIAGLSPEHEILADIREIDAGLTHEEVYELIKELEKHRDFFHNKIAILSRDDDQYSRAGLFEICANLQGFQVAAFIDFEKAISWLNGTSGLEELFE